ncbi:MAG: VWA domain-containing protein [Nostocaceae cyanobacterium]|nr:VWA domain-containing protein [Nostocaceae cyanobacterium]
MTEDSATVVPSRQHLSPVQKIGLNLVSYLHGGRDVVLAIDLTESVGLNDEGRIRLRQIVKDSLKPGDSVYIVPFARNVIWNEVTSVINPLGIRIEFKSENKDNVDKILAKIPLNSDSTRYNTDIQRAELIVYQGIAQLNQNRLQKNQPIKPQSVVWVTDAPLLREPGITSDVWVETPAQSPFRIANSLESQQRQAWIEALPIQVRWRSITTKDNREYKLTVVDIVPTVQEFCTPAPGGEETCLVNSYLIKQLWLPGLVFFLILVSTIFGVIKFWRLQKKWELIVDFEVTAKPEDQKCRLPNKKRIAIGEFDASCVDSIDCPGEEVRAYLVRKGEKLYLEPTNLAPIYYQGRKIDSRIVISRSRFRLNCPDAYNREYEIVIQIKK